MSGSFELYCKRGIRYDKIHTFIRHFGHQLNTVSLSDSINSTQDNMYLLYLVSYIFLSDEYPISPLIGRSIQSPSTHLRFFKVLFSLPS